MSEVAVHGGAGALANPGDFDPNLGLEDVDASDLIIPRINIDHDNALFVNSMTKETFSGLTCVILGLVKQRVMWPPKLEDDSKPQCKSTDNVHGFPNMRDGQPTRNLFPWSKSNFDRSQVRTVELEPGQDSRYPNGWSSNGYGVLPCDSCVFAKWGKDEDGNNTPPPCSEQHTYPMLYLTRGIDEEGNEFDHWQPAIFTVQRSSIKNSREFINTFAQSKQPFFTYYTTLTLTVATRGKNEFAIPNFKRSNPSDRNNWSEYGIQLRQIREFLRAAPRPQEGEGDGEGVTATSSSNENVAPQPQSPPDAPAAPAAAPPQPPAASAVPQPPASPQAPVAPAPPSPPPAAPAQQAPAAPQPPTPPAPPAPPAPPTPAAPAAGEDSPSSLPF